MEGHQAWGIHVQSEARLLPPAWVLRLLNRGRWSHETVISSGLTIRCRRSDQFTLASVCVPRARRLEPLDLQRLTVAAYDAINTAIRHGPASHPVRFWNFIPQIGQTMDDRGGHKLDRYMIFNAGRYAAYAKWYGDRETLGRMVATASGVGHDGADLLIHCLAAQSSGVAVENPRQVPSYCYSSRYGPLPPSFARATVVTNIDTHREPLTGLRPRGEPLGEPQHSGLQSQILNLKSQIADVKSQISDSKSGISDRESPISDFGFQNPAILIGGTASIRGECSAHQTSIAQQTRETLENLAALVRQACTVIDAHAAARLNGDPRAWLDRLRFVRIYYVFDQHRPFIESALRVPLCSAIEVEWARARLCRPELLIEIEGVAEALPSSQVNSAASSAAADTMHPRAHFNPRWRAMISGARQRSTDASPAPGAAASANQDDQPET